MTSKETEQQQPNVTASPQPQDTQPDHDQFWAFLATSTHAPFGPDGNPLPPGKSSGAEVVDTKIIMETEDELAAGKSATTTTATTTKKKGK